MGISMLLIAAVHIAFLNPDFRPDGAQDTGWILFVGDVPILVMVLAWELPTAALILVGLYYQSRKPQNMGVVLSLGVTAYAAHLWYFPPAILFAILVVAIAIARARRSTNVALPTP